MNFATITTKISSFPSSFWKPQILISTILPIPSQIIYPVNTAISISIAFISSSCSIFPFSFGWHTKTTICKLIQLGNKLLTFIPTHIYYRKSLTYYFTWIFTHHSLPKLLRHLRLSDIERTNCYFMHGFFIVFCFIGTIAHIKSTAFNIFHGKGNPFDCKRLVLSIRHFNRS